MIDSSGKKFEEDEKPAYREQFPSCLNSKVGTNVIGHSHLEQFFFQKMNKFREIRVETAQGIWTFIFPDKENTKVLKYFFM